MLEFWLSAYSRQHYCDHCTLHHYDPVNQASFGKLIRSVFPNLKVSSFLVSFHWSARHGALAPVETPNITTMVFVCERHLHLPSRQTRCAQFLTFFGIGVFMFVFSRFYCILCVALRHNNPRSEVLTIATDHVPRATRFLQAHFHYLFSYGQSIAPFTIDTV